MDVPKLTPEMMATWPPEAVAFIQLLLAKIADLEERLNIFALVGALCSQGVGDFGNRARASSGGALRPVGSTG